MFSLGGWVLVLEHPVTTKLLRISRLDVVQSMRRHAPFVCAVEVVRQIDGKRRRMDGAHLLESRLNNDTI